MTNTNPTAAQPLALIAQARAVQPESATGTTGASIKTWQERMGPGYIDGGADLPEEIAMKAEIADLRAQLAATTESLQIAAREAWDANAELSKLRAQLAARGDATHGQGDPVAIVVTKGGQPHIDIIDATIKIGDHLYLAAPASAQPADACCKWPTCQSEEVQQRVADQAYRELYSGAQPDRGAACKHEFAYFGDQPERRCAHCDMVESNAAAPSPASQPVAPTSPHDVCRASEHNLRDTILKLQAELAAVAPSDAKGKAQSCDHCGYDHSVGPLCKMAADAKGKADAANAGTHEVEQAALWLKDAKLWRMWHDSQAAHPRSNDYVRLFACKIIGATIEQGIREAELRRSPATSAADAKDAARWRFMMAVVDNDDGPEADAMSLFARAADDNDSRPESVQMAEIVDKALAAMAAAPSSEKGCDK